MNDRVTKKKEMMTLGPVPVGEWLELLDNGSLVWWRDQCKRSEVRVARERWDSGARMHPVLAMAINEGMVRLSKRLPFVQWGFPSRTGREKKLGFYPERGRIVRALGKGEVVLIQHGEEKPALREWQKYWLVVADEEYRLVGVSGKVVWVMPERWYGKSIFTCRQ